MENKLSKYIYVTDSYNNKSKLLYNSKEPYFIKYSKKDFGEVSNFIRNEEVSEYLREKGFFETNDDLDTIKRNHLKSLESNDTLMLIIKVTKDCNFRCSYCYENFSSVKINDEKADSIIKFIKNELKNKYRNLIISWFGGEPLLNMNAIEKISNVIIPFCEENNIYYSSSIVSNGYILTNDYVSRLLSFNVRTFQITIDGDSSLHDSQRKLINGNKTFGVIYNNLKSLKQNKGDFQVVLRTNISRKMLGNMEQYYISMKDFFSDERFYAAFHSVVDFDDMSHDVSDMELITEILEGAKNGFRFTPILDYLDYNSSFCYAIRNNQYVIDSELNVSKCTVVNEPYSNIGNITKNGKLKTNAFAAIWKAARISQKCIQCNYYASCGGGACPLYYLKHGTARCMKFKSEASKHEVLKVADLLGEEDIYIHL